MGGIDGSGLYFKEEYAHLDAGSREIAQDNAPPGCRCGDVLIGNLSPADCPLFGGACTPGDPRGACMVSEEGACHAHFSYERTGSK